jgi:hypothetical protein
MWTGDRNRLARFLVELNGRDNEGVRPSLLTSLQDYYPTLVFTSLSTVFVDRHCISDLTPICARVNVENFNQINKGCARVIILEPSIRQCNIPLSPYHKNILLLGWYNYIDRALVNRS